MNSETFSTASYEDFLQQYISDVHNNSNTKNNHDETTNITSILNPQTDLSPDILAAQLSDGLAVLSLLSSSIDETGQRINYYNEVESLPSVDIWAEMERNYQNKVANNNKEEEELQLDLGLQMSLGLDVVEDPVEWLMITGPGGEYTEQVWGDKVVDQSDLKNEEQVQEEVPIQSSKGKEKGVVRSPVLMRSRM